MSRSQYPEFVPDCFVRPLSRHGFRVVQTARSASFGNAFTLLLSSGMRIRFVRDRGDVYIEVAPCDDGEWYGLNLIWIMHNHRPFAEDASDDTLARFLNDNYEKLVNQLNMPEKMYFDLAYENARRARIKAMFPGAVVGPDDEKAS